MFAKLTGKVTRSPRPHSDDAVVVISANGKKDSTEQTKLTETMKVVRKNFHKVDIVIVGEPHMLTKAISDPSHDPEKMRPEAIQEGRDLLARSQAAINLLDYTDDQGIRHSKLRRVLEWADCVAEKKEDYERLLTWLRGRYANPADPFRKTVDVTANSFLERMKR